MNQKFPITEEMIETMMADGRLTDEQGFKMLKTFFPHLFDDPPLPDPMPKTGAIADPSYRLEFLIARAEAGRQLFSPLDPRPGSDDHVGQTVQRDGGNHSRLKIGDAQAPGEEDEDEDDWKAELFADLAARRKSCKPSR